jgi:segregation and condensation protein B
MLSDENLKALLEAIIYVAPEPVTLEALVKSLEGEERERVKAKLGELMEEYAQPGHGIEIRGVAGGYKFSSKAEHHEVLRRFVKSLKPPIRLSKPALETLAVIAYRQPVTLPEIDEIRGVDCGGVIHTLLEKKLVVTAGRKNVVGRPILYRTSRDFLVHFGLKEVGDLPSLREFEEMARQALGADLARTSELEAPPAGEPARATAEERAEVAPGEEPAVSEPTPSEETPS